MIRLLDHLEIEQAAAESGAEAIAAVVSDSQLALVRIPMLAITGTTERQLAGANALKAIVPNLDLVVIPGATHAALVGRPEFVEAVRMFIDGL